MKVASMLFAVALAVFEFSSTAAQPSWGSHVEGGDSAALPAQMPASPSVITVLQSRLEQTAAGRAISQRLDSDHDGQLSAQELSA
eukprot:6754111-Prymnesium_polylepis.1